MKKILIAVLLLVALGLVGVSLASLSTPDGLGLQAGKLADCPDSPNCVCSEQADLPSSIEPLRFRGDGNEAMTSLLAFLQAESRVNVVTIKEGYLHAVYATPLMRYRDDVEFRLDEEAGVIHVRSASRVGRSDMGANRERIESLRARWQAPE